jgi:hypothetical protein
MQSNELFPKSEADIEKEYKQKIFLTTLKEGKSPRRKCLMKNILYLSGIYKAYRIGGVAANIPLNCGFDRKYEFWIHHNYKVRHILENERFINNLKRYLVQFRFEDNPYYEQINRFNIFYNNHSIKWALIDHDLKTNHPDNILIKPNGFVYIKNYRK